MSGFDDDPFSGLDTVEDIPEPKDAAARDALSASAGMPLNDYGNGQRYVIHFGADSMFVPRVGWHVWDGLAWAKDSDQLAVRRRAQRLSDLITQEVPFVPFRGDRFAAAVVEHFGQMPKSDLNSEQLADLDAARKTIGRHRSFANTTGNSARIDNALKESGVDLAVEFESLDSDPLTLNTEGATLRFVTEDSGPGTPRLARVIEHRHVREDRLTKVAPVVYDPDARSPLFDAFLERIQPDIEMRGFLQRWLGLSMTGLPMQRLAFFYGAGANGKSVLVDIVARILGNYAATARIESLTGTARRGGGDATPDLIPLIGARFVRTSEPDEGQRLQEGLIKELTGGEPLQVRALHSDFVEVRPIFKMTMSGNHKPEIRGTDDGIWRRVMLVPFDVQIPEAERDPELVDKLFSERAGLFNWLVEGLLDVLETGLRPPDAVTEATKEYREESDPIGLFLTTCCVVSGDPADALSSAELGHAFSFHLMERGMTIWKSTTFARQIAVKARTWRHPETGRRFEKGKASVTQYLGLRFTDAFKRRFDDAPKDHTGRPLGVGARAPSGEDASPHPHSDQF
jgi:putative DNA primase/helicase